MKPACSILSCAALLALSACAVNNGRQAAMARRAKENAQQRDAVIEQRDTAIQERDAEMTRRQEVEVRAASLIDQVAKVRIDSIVPRAWKIVVDTPEGDATLGEQPAIQTALTPLILKSATLPNRPMSNDPNGRSLMTSVEQGRLVQLGRSSVSVRAQRGQQALPWAYLTIDGGDSTTGLLALCNGETQVFRLDLKVDGENGAAATKVNLLFQGTATFDHGGRLGFRGPLLDEDRRAVTTFELVPLNER